MSLNETVSAERLHISFFGRRNAGKSSLVNAVTGQKLAVVSPVKGTTTDPVQKAMELLPLGPVVIIDTPGYDDEGELGALRVEKTNEVLNKTDVAVLVYDAAEGLSEEDRALLDTLRKRGLPVILAANKTDLLTAPTSPAEPTAISVSALTGEGVHELKERLADLGRSASHPKLILADLVVPGDTVVLVIPVDESAPKGRLILPQQQTLRELLDLHCKAICCQVEEIPGVLTMLKTPPRLVVTDSQAFGKVSPLVPAEIPLTSFSILFARYKGQLSTLTAGAKALSALQDGDRVLISEGCTHHRQCNDIGTVKIPGWVRKYTGKNLTFSFTSGGEFPTELQDYALVIHCGGCMLNEAAMRHRMEVAQAAGVPMVNYGVAIAQMHGILKRSLEPFINDL
ncbi:MAG: [Oscillospiraceae bacterium]|nr:[FeFe] hydrogenase H-cluster maturation GTPase HydF [Oscillospiraceae bacterium]